MPKPSSRPAPRATGPAPDLTAELAQQTYEPLLPIERKLIGWSLGTGLVLLAVLAVISRLVPLGTP